MTDNNKTFECDICYETFDLIDACDYGASKPCCESCLESLEEDSFWRSQEMEGL